MELKTFKSDFILLLVAVIWGFAFVAQRIGMNHVGPYTFNGVRFALGGLSLVPFLVVGQRRRKQKNIPGEASPGEVLKGGILAGIVLFVGSTLQQVGLVYTTAGKAGFITGLYVVIVPVIGLFFWGQKTSVGTWVGGGLAAVGLYLLSVTAELTINYGDFLELLGAFCFACHVLIIGRLTMRIDAVRLSFIQCMVCSLASLILAVFLESFTFISLYKAALPIFYGGVFSVGIAYSLQIYGQKGSYPAHAAILLSLESVVAALGGWLILNEVLSGRAVLGCALMMAGMLLSQLYAHLKGRANAPLD